MTGTPPRKRPSPAVYRRRRIVLLLAVVAVIALVWLLIAQPWAGAAVRDDSAQKSPASAVTQSAATELPVPGASAAAGDAAADTSTVETAPGELPSAKACVSGDIAVEALADAESYGTGQNPQLSIRLSNQGETDCTLNVGTSGQVFTITSGDDVWWRSTDCQSEPSDMVVLLAAGQSVTSAAPLTWDRTRSSVGSCDDPARQSAPGGGASYYLSVEIGGIASTQPTLFLLY